MNPTGLPQRRIATVAVLVSDYDEAARWYSQVLGFQVVEDTNIGDGKRWLVMSAGAGGARMLLAKAADERQRAAVGDQTGGRVFLFLETDDFARDHTLMLEQGVTFKEQPRHESYGTVAVFSDLYGNLWDLIEPKQAPVD